MLQKLHHVAYRCRDAAETVKFYEGILGLKFTLAKEQDAIPSSGIHQPHNHIFFEMEDGSSIAFFDILGDKHPTTPVEKDWAQHLALEVASEEKAQEIAARLKAAGVDVLLTRHPSISSWYFFDPNGHRLELAVRNPGYKRPEEAATPHEDLARWQRRKASVATA